MKNVILNILIHVVSFYGMMKDITHIPFVNTILINKNASHMSVYCSKASLPFPRTKKATSRFPHRCAAFFDQPKVPSPLPRPTRNHGKALFIVFGHIVSIFS